MVPTRVLLAACHASGYRVNSKSLGPSANERWIVPKLEQSGSVAGHVGLLNRTGYRGEGIIRVRANETNSTYH